MFQFWFTIFWGIFNLLFSLCYFKSIKNPQKKTNVKIKHPYRTSMTQDSRRSGSSSIPANLNIQITISLISSTSMDTPPSASKAPKIQLSFSSGVVMFFTLAAWYHSKKLKVPLLSSSNTLTRAFAFRSS